MIFSSKGESFRFKNSSEKFSARLIIILVFGIMVEVTSVTTIASKATILQGLSSDSLGDELCLRDESKNLYSAADLLRCLNRLAFNIPFQNALRLREERAGSGSQRDNLYNQFTSGYVGRQYNELEQSYFSAKSDLSHYQRLIFPPRRQPGYYVPGSEYASAPSLSEFQFSEGASVRFFKALSSISQYDDLQCVPRILCEATTGVMPGSEAYKEASSLQNFGNNALIGLLSAFVASETSPFLNFAKAAILGYSSRGNPTTCFREYPKCPRNYDSLVHYLNNHKGGFFRFFGGLTGGYRPISQTPFNQAGLEISKSKIINGDSSVLNADHTDSGDFQFDAHSTREHDHHSFKSFLVFPGDNNRSESEQIIFPVQGKIRNQASVNRMAKSLISDSNFSSANNVNHQKSFSFFPQDKRK